MGRKCRIHAGVVVAASVHASREYHTRPMAHGKLNCLEYRLMLKPKRLNSPLANRPTLLLPQANQCPDNISSNLPYSLESTSTYSCRPTNQPARSRQQAASRIICKNGRQLQYMHQHEVLVFETCSIPHSGTGEMRLAVVLIAVQCSREAEPVAKTYGRLPSITR